MKTFIETYGELLESNMTSKEKIEYYLNLAKLAKMDYDKYTAKVRELIKEKEGE